MSPHEMKNLHELKQVKFRKILKNKLIMKRYRNPKNGNVSIYRKILKHQHLKRWLFRFRKRILKIRMKNR